MTKMCQREIIVRPHEDEELVVPIQEEAGDLENGQETEEKVAAEEKVVDIDMRPVWEKMQDKVEDLATKVTRHFEDNNDRTGWQPPMVKTPAQPTREEWFRHQLIHTPYAPWCRHCCAARAVRNNHQCANRRARLVPDVDTDAHGLVKISMDYMYLHERVGRFKEEKHNPPYLVVVEHKHGRVWAYQTQNKGPNEEACWLPGKLIQDWDD